MAVIYSTAYPFGGAYAGYPLTHARILHSGIWLDGGTATASTTEAGYFEDGPQDVTTYERWAPTTAPATWEDDFGEDVTADCFCIAAHTAGTIGATVTFEAYISSAWVEIGEVTPTDDMPIMLLLGEEVTFTKWRISIDEVCEIGVAMAGVAMQMPTRIYGGHQPMHLSRTVEYRSNRSETGEFLGMTKQRVSLDTSYSWQHLEAEWVRTNWRPFMLAMEDTPFFIAWRPDAFAEVGYAWASAPAIPSNMGMRSWMSVELGVTGHGYD